MSWLDDDEEVTEDERRIEEAGGWRAWLPSRVTLRRFISDPESLAMIVGGIAVAFGLSFWLGWGVLVLLAATGGAFVALLVGMLIGLDTQMDDFRVDLLKCFVASLVLVVPAWLMIHFGLAGYGLVAPVLVTYLAIKILWRDFVVSEVIVVEAGMFLGIVFGSCLAAALSGA